MAEYIEREAFFRFLTEQKDKETGAYSKGRNAGLDVARSALHNREITPAADVAPVVHGEWKPKYDKKDGYWHNICSACKVEAPFEYEYEPDYDEGLDGEWHYIGQMECGIRECLTNYCPNCGAKMNGGTHGQGKS